MVNNNNNNSNEIDVHNLNLIYIQSVSNNSFL